ncbi:MAG: hypothetical protein ACRCTN_03245 [Carnobacterium maltaromaticum]
MNGLIITSIVCVAIYLKFKHINELWETKESEMTPIDWFQEYAGLISMILFVPISLVIWFFA